MVIVKVNSPMWVLATVTIATTNPQKAGKVSIVGTKQFVDFFMQDMRGLQGQPIGNFAIAADVVCALQRLKVGTVEVKGDIALPPAPPGVVF